MICKIYFLSFPLMTSLVWELHYPNEDKKILYKHTQNAEQMWCRDVRRVAFPSFISALARARKFLCGA